MIGLIIATSVIGAVLVSAIVVGAIKLHKMEKNMTTLAECLLTYMTNPESVDIIEEYTNMRSNSDFDFPNSTGF
jgi:putative effector of murein hydrolase LrgA (UPF0299 family)